MTSSMVMDVDATQATLTGDQFLGTGGEDDQIPHNPNALNANIAAPDVDLDSFAIIRTKVDMSNVKVPPMTPRDVDRNHVWYMKRGFQKNGYRGAFDTLAVTPCVMGNAGREKDEKDASESYSTVWYTGHQEKAEWLIDGRHRLVALPEFQDESLKWKEVVKKLEVTRWVRKDKKPLTMLDVLGIGIVLNRSSSNHLPMSFKDLVYAGVSVPKIVSLRGLDVKTVSVNSFSKVLQKMKTLGDLRGPQIQRYAQVVLKLAGSNVAFKHFLSACEKSQKLALVHLSSNVLLQLEDLPFSTCLNMVIFRLSIEQSGSFEMIRKQFFLCAMLLYEEVEKFAKLHNIEMKELLGRTLNLSGSAETTVENFITIRMARFNLSIKQDNSNRLRVNAVRNRLTNWLGPCTEETGADGNLVLNLEENISPEEHTSRSRRSKAHDRNAGRREWELGSSESINTPPKSLKVMKTTRNRRTMLKGGENSVEDANNRHFKARTKTLTPRDVIRDDSDGDYRERDYSSSKYSGKEEEMVILGGSKFQDEIPDQLPVGVKDAVSYEGLVSPAWAEISIRLPSEWECSTKILHPTTFLQRIYMPIEHRSHHFVNNVEVLRANHHAVFWRSAYDYYMEHGVDGIQFEQREGLETYKKTSESFWEAALIRDYVARDYLAERGTEIREKGFTIMEELIDDSEMPTKTCGGQAVVRFLLMWTELLFHMTKAFPRNENDRDTEFVKKWTSIRGQKNRENGRARYQRTNYGAMEALEDRETLWAGRARARMDVRIGQVCAALRLWDNSVKEMKMYCPRSGGRFLLTSRGCQRQMLHTEFSNSTRSEVMSKNSNPGYFCIGSGTDEIAIWVCEHSHRMVAAAAENSVCRLGRGMVVDLVRIPLYSMFIGRGDVFHAGAAFRDSPLSENQMRYHMYLIPQQYELPDGIELMTKFKPLFLRGIHDEAPDREIAAVRRGDLDEGTEEEVLGKERGSKNIGAIRRRRQLISLSENGSSSSLIAFGEVQMAEVDEEGTSVENGSAQKS